jgi:hypothetical protein
VPLLPLFESRAVLLRLRWRNRGLVAVCRRAARELVSFGSLEKEEGKKSIGFVVPAVIDELERARDQPSNYVRGGGT